MGSFRDLSVYIATIHTKMTDFNISILQAFIDGNASPEQEKLIFEWLECSEENRRFFAELSSNVTLHETLADSSFDEHREDMIARLNSRIDAEEEPVQKHKSSFHATIIGLLAASVAAAVAAIFIIPVLSTPKTDVSIETVPAPRMFTYANSDISVKHMMLADGTKVFLKPGSELEYNVTGIADRREIVIRGEGYFDVAKDSLRPMFVRTEKLSVKVLGTAFTVKTQNASDDVEVVLERGSVRLLSNDGVGLVRMVPNQRAVFSSSTGDVSIESLNAFPYVVEQFNLESLDNATLGQIIRHLEHIYGVSLKADIKHPEKRYYFNFLRSDSIEDVLNIVENLTSEDVTINTNN